jgi:hypothetical protein
MPFTLVTTLAEVDQFKDRIVALNLHLPGRFTATGLPNVSFALIEETFYIPLPGNDSPNLGRAFYTFNDPSHRGFMCRSFTNHEGILDSSFNVRFALPSEIEKLLQFLQENKCSLKGYSNPGAIERVTQLLKEARLNPPAYSNFSAAKEEVLRRNRGPSYF